MHCSYQQSESGAVRAKIPYSMSCEALNMSKEIRWKIIETIIILL